MQSDLIDIIEMALLSWLNDPDNSGLEESVVKTIEMGHFHSYDVYYSIEQLKEAVERSDLKIWADKLNLQKKVGFRNKKILCLHAGNLPLVGMQDVIACLLSGMLYAGKVSQKDPYLIPSFLRHLRKVFPIFEDRFTISSDLNDFENLVADYWMFSGSESSLKEIRSILIKKKIVKKSSDSLLRVAHFSVALIRNHQDDSILSDLVESILRYDGKGCRSVALVYSDVPLKEVSARLKQLGDNWLDQSKRGFNPIVGLKWKHAYNSSIGVEQVWVGNTLVQEGIPVVGHNQHVFWLNSELLNEHLRIYGNAVQQVYSHNLDQNIVSELYQNKLDYLKNSQCPSLYWAPDGIDPLQWILTR